MGEETSMKYEDILDAHSRFKNDPSYQERPYEELIVPIKNPWDELDSIIDFVRRWTKRVPIEKNRDQIKNVALSLKDDFKKLEFETLENIVFTPENVTIIKKIFEQLSSCPSKFVATSKLMHGINPHLFVMWDQGIYTHYGCKRDSTGYIKFMHLIQTELKEVMVSHTKEEIIQQTGRSLPKLIDEYNWHNFRTSKI
jgi:hypothetical protein